MTSFNVRVETESLRPVSGDAVVDGSDGFAHSIGVRLLERAGFTVRDEPDATADILVVVLLGNEAFGGRYPYAGLPRRRVERAVNAMQERGHGRAILITDAGPHVHDAADPGLAADRAADLMWWQHLAKRAASNRVSLNTIRCGYAPSLGHELPLEREAQLLRRLVIRRPLRDEDIVSAVRLLLSRGFGNVNGGVLALDGKMDAGIVPMPGGRAPAASDDVELGDPFYLSGKTVLLTGASSGIGAATAKELAERGADLVLVARSQAQLDEVADLVTAAGQLATVITADLSDPDSVWHLVGKVWDASGGVDAFVHAAGIVAFDIPGADNTELRTRMTRINTESYATISENLVNRWTTARRGGAIAAVSSLSGHCAPVANLLSYGYSKAALGMYTEHLATTTARRGIRANCVVPGFVRTPMTDVTNKDFLKATLDLVPTGRMTEPEEVAALLAYLISPAAGYVTGAQLVIDGGGQTLLGI